MLSKQSSTCCTIVKDQAVCYFLVYNMLSKIAKDLEVFLCLMLCTSIVSFFKFLQFQSSQFDEEIISQMLLVSISLFLLLSQQIF